MRRNIGRGWSENESERGGETKRGYRRVQGLIDYSRGGARGGRETANSTIKHDESISGGGV